MLRQIAATLTSRMATTSSLLFTPFPTQYQSVYGTENNSSSDAPKNMKVFLIALFGVNAVIFGLWHLDEYRQLIHEEFDIRLLFAFVLSFLTFLLELMDTTNNTCMTISRCRMLIFIFIMITYFFYLLFKIK